MMRRLLATALVMVLALGLLAGCGGSKSVADRVKQSGVLKVGFEGTYPPFNYLNEQNQYDGFDVDIANEIARRLGVKTEFVATEWKGLIGGLDADKFDVIIAQMSITEERKQSIDFTDPYVITGAVLATKKGGKRYASLDDLKGATVATGAGTTFHDILKGVEGIELKTYDSFGDYVADVLNGRADVLMNDQLTVGYAIASGNLDLEITSPVLNEDVIGIGVKKGNEEFVKQLNQILSEMKADGTYREIFMKWFGTEPALK